MALSFRRSWKLGATLALIAVLLLAIPSAGAGDAKLIRTFGAFFGPPGELTNVGGTLFFRGADSRGIELWSSDGTRAGTGAVRDINPGGHNAHSFPKALTDVGGTLFFTAFSRGHGDEPWRSDGTRAGTTLVRDISPTSSSRPHYFTSVGGALLFAARDGVHGFELWRSDGTEPGTMLVRDIRPGGASSYPLSQRTDVDGTLFFQVDDGTHGPELWRSDGTEAGTTLVRDIFPGSGEPDSSPYGIAELTNVDGTLFFVADDGSRGFELWRSNGTEAGTTLVRDIKPGGVNSHSYPEALTEVGGTLFFTAGDGSGRALWRSDGTEAGTVPIKEIKTGRRRVSHLRDVAGTLFFTHKDQTHGLELWRSDGTPAGTRLVRDIRPGSKGSVPDDSGFESRGPLLTDVDGTLCFVANDGTHGVELWRSDGTRAGTRLLDDIKPGKRSPHPRELTRVGGRLFFVAKAVGGPRKGPGLWKTRP